MNLPSRENDRMEQTATVMASIDRRPDGDYLIIADLSDDGGWLSVPLSDGLVLPDHR